MIGSRARRLGGGQDNSWPGFVDALSTLLLVIIFLLSMFVLAQFFLGQALSGREQALSELRAQVAELGNLLRLEQQSNTALRDSLSELSASLTAANADRDALTAALNDAQSQLSASTLNLEAITQARNSFEEELVDLRTRYRVSEAALTEERAISERAQAEVASLRRSVTSLSEQLARLEAALEASEERDRRNQAVIVDLGRRLNRALASKVEELVGYRSEFFGRLREVLADRPDIRIEGDRFVFDSELLFTSASAELEAAGRAQLAAFADTLNAIAADIPDEVDWILRVDGHTDRRPIRNAAYATNWELSAARAISVVNFLVQRGVPPERLAATGFGEFQPLDPTDTAAAYARNRRIEFRLTQR